MAAGRALLVDCRKAIGRLPSGSPGVALNRANPAGAGWKPRQVFELASLYRYIAGVKDGGGSRRADDSWGQQIVLCRWLVP